MLKNDERYEKLARMLGEFSINVQKGEWVLVNTIDIPYDMTIALIEAIHSRSAVPFLRLQSDRITCAENKILSEEAVARIEEMSIDEMKKMQAFIALCGGNNAFYQSDVAQEQRIGSCARFKIGASKKQNG